MEIEIKKKIDISKDDLLDILCCSFENGMAYWAGFIDDSKEYQECKKELIENNTDYCWEDVVIRMWEKGYNLELYAVEEYEKDKNGNTGRDNDYWKVSQDDYLKAIAQYMSEYESDLDNFDADSGDVIMQLAVFNNIIFG